MKKPLGLVLGGGLSSRMGQDKAQLVYPSLSDKPSAERLREALLPVCGAAFISARPEQEISSQFRIDDSVTGSGPGVGILSAAAQFPGEAWLVLACDFAFAEQSAFEYLLGKRDSRKAATYFLAGDSRPEPLFAIWEKSGIAALKEDFAGQQFSPRATLERLDCEPVTCPWAIQLVNINSLREAKAHRLS